MQNPLIRADAWRILAQAFERPNAENLDALDELTGELAEALRNHTHPLAEPIAAFRKTFDDLDPDLLEQEYHFLFTTQMLATPNESSYHRTSRGAVVGDIAGFYTAFGLRLRAEHDTPDHLRNEIAFMVWLTIKEINALQNGPDEAVDITRDAQRKFLADHLGRWASAFVERLLNASVTPFYREAGALLIAVLNDVTAELGVRNVMPLDSDGAPAEPEVMPCPAAGACALREDGVR